MGQRFGRSPLASCNDLGAHRRFGEALSDTVLSGFQPNAGDTLAVIVSNICALYSTSS